MNLFSCLLFPTLQILQTLMINKPNISKITRLLFAALAITIFNFYSTLAQVSNQHIDWLNKHSHTIESLTSENFNDLQFLPPLLEDKRIVQLGESAHGVAEQPKTNIYYPKQNIQPWVDSLLLKQL